MPPRWLQEAWSSSDIALMQRYRKFRYLRDKR